MHIFQNMHPILMKNCASEKDASEKDAFEKDAF